MTIVTERDPARPATAPDVFGEDVGTLGGVFRVTDGLAAAFGEARVFDTPLSESGIVGTAIGMAMNGLRPVVEMQFDAFAYPAFEQITSHLAKLPNRTRGRVGLPVVIRIPYGGGIGGVEHHCDSSEAYYAHTAGLRVITPATPGDAYALLRQAIDSPDPAIFLEPKRRYWARQATVLDHTGAAPLDRAVVRRPGSDVTLIAYGNHRLAREGRGHGRRRPGHCRGRDGQGRGRGARAVRRPCDRTARPARRCGEHALEAAEHQFAQGRDVARPDEQDDVGVPGHQGRVLDLRDGHQPGPQALPGRLGDLQVHVGAAVRPARASRCARPRAARPRWPGRRRRARPSAVRRPVPSLIAPSAPGPSALA